MSMSSVRRVVTEEVLRHALEQSATHRALGSDLLASGDTDDRQPSQRNLIAPLHYRFIQEAEVATAVDARCRACEHSWSGELLGGTRMAGKYRCTRCGEARSVTSEDLDAAGLTGIASIWDMSRRQARKVLGRCSCGGAYDHRAAVRCPHCHSADLELTDLGIRVD